MNPYRILHLMILSALLIAGCETPMDQEPLSPTTFTAAIELDAATKTALGAANASGIRTVQWSSGDKIAIGGGTYTVSSGAGSTQATFTGTGATKTGTVYKAYYPVGVYNNGTPTLPATQTYVAGRIDNLPMYAEATTTDLIFRNLCTVLQLNLTGDGTRNVRYIEVESTEGLKLSGAFTVNWNSGDPTLTMDPSASSKVTLHCGTAGVALNATPKSFYIAVPAQSYTKGKLKVTVKDPSGIEFASFISQSDLNEARSTIVESTLSTKEQSMSFVIETDATYRDLQFPFVASGGAVRIDWGDGTGITTHPAGSTISHTYTVSRRMTITIKANPGTMLDFAGGNVSSHYFPTYYNVLKEVNEPLFPALNLDEAFYDCKNLTTVCEDLLVNNGHLRTLNSLFGGCTSLTSVPENLFKMNTELEFLRCTFEHSGLTSLPAGLFANNRKIHSFNETFYYCRNLTSLPANLFANNTEATDFYGTFNGCESLNSVPANLFAKNTKAENFYQTFFQCKSLKSVPANLFANNPEAKSFDQTFCYSDLSGPLSNYVNLFANNKKVTNFHLVFAYCENLTGNIPANLFANNPEVTTFDGTFHNCAGLTGSIPGNLFANNKKVKSFYGVFRGCAGLTGSIPGNLFANNTEVEEFQVAFASCIKLSGIPASLFASNTKAKDFRETFKFCSRLTELPGALFANNTEATEFFGTFNGCSGLTGTIPAN